MVTGLVIFDSVNTDCAREKVTFRREACLLMTSDDAEGVTGAKRRKIHHILHGIMSRMRKPLAYCYALLTGSALLLIILCLLVYTRIMAK